MMAVAGLEVAVGLLAAAVVVALNAARGATAPARPVVEPGPVRSGRSDPPAVSVRSAPQPALVVAVVLLVLLVAWVVGPLVALVGTALVGGARVRSARRHRQAARRLVQGAVPDLVDLFVVAAAAGHPVPACLEMVAPRAPEAVRTQLSQARAAVVHGQRVDAALAELGRQLGPLGSALTGALSGSSATGAPLVPALDRVAVLARDHRRRDAETLARRLPVTMLFPLVCCILPAFVLLAVVPLLAASLTSLDL